MRILAIILIISLSACSSYPKLDGLYFSNKQDCLMIQEEDRTAQIENIDDVVLDDLHVKQKGKKITFTSGTTPLYGKKSKKDIKKYTFKYVYNRDDSFMLAPVSKLAKKYFAPKKTVVFKSKYLYADRNFAFDSIIYHSSRCMGNCYGLHLQLDKEGNLKVTDNGDGITDTTRNDNYAGKLNVYELEKLNKILRYAQIKTLKWPPRMCCDGPMVTLIVYQNTKRYYFKAMFLPLISYDLRQFLDRQFFNKSLQKTEETFKYEE